MMGEVLTARDLASAELGDGRGIRLAVVGYPVRHSLSPVMHSAALDDLGRKDPSFRNWVYGALELQEEEFLEWLPLLRERGFRGLNLTLPHKVSVVPALVRTTPEAALMGAVNTLIAGEDGWEGANTDGFGIEWAIREDFGIGIRERDIWIWGAGGASRAITLRLLQSGCSRLTLVNRNPDRLGTLLELAEPVAQGRLRGYPPESQPGDFAADALLINATSLGLKAGDPAPIRVQSLPLGVSVYDTTYGVANRLRSDCERRGIRYADGLSMLVGQGVRSLEIWTGHEVNAEIMELAVRAELQKRRNYAAE